MLPAFASLAEFADRIPGGIPAGEEARAAAALDDASALIRAEVPGITWVVEGALSGVPDVVTMVCIAAARRSFINPHAVEGETAGPFGAQYGSASPDVYLTKRERQLVRRGAGRSGLWTLGTTRTDVAGDVPAVTPYGWSTGSPEEVDPFLAGWTG